MLATLLLSSLALTTEATFVDAFCPGLVEYQLEDGTRVDCLTEDEAQEYDWGKKWHEAIGQALWYAANTGRRATIVLIMKDSRDEIGLWRARRVVSHYGLPITIRVATQEGVE